MKRRTSGYGWLSDRIASRRRTPREHAHSRAPQPARAGRQSNCSCVARGTCTCRAELGAKARGRTSHAAQMSATGTCRTAVAVVPGSAGRWPPCSAGVAHRARRRFLRRGRVPGAAVTALNLDTGIRTAVATERRRALHDSTAAAGPLQHHGRLVRLPPQTKSGLDARRAADGPIRLHARPGSRGGNGRGADASRRIADVRSGARDRQHADPRFAPERTQSARALAAHARRDAAGHGLPRHPQLQSDECQHQRRPGRIERRASRRRLDDAA